MTAPALAGRFDGVLNLAMSQAASKAPSRTAIKAKEQAQDFEAVFLNSMFQHMMTGIEGDGPFGGSTGIGVWRSFMTSEFAKSVASKGGIGIADQVYSSLIAQQAASSNVSNVPSVSHASEADPAATRKGDH